MDALQVFEVKAAIEKRLIFEIAEVAKFIDVSKYPRVRFVIELNFDSNGSLVDSGIEPRFRRALK